ncbi:MAG: hypothetical protein ACTSUO_00830 [Candidatus Thorarchaeota archaeon]
MVVYINDEEKEVFMERLKEENSDIYDIVRTFDQIYESHTREEKLLDKFSVLCMVFDSETKFVNTVFINWSPQDFLKQMGILIGEYINRKFEGDIEKVIAALMFTKTFTDVLEGSEK